MPPKVSASTKNKTIEGYIGGANASGHASDSRSSEPPAKANSTDDKTQTYEICKEMCREMSASILEKLDERFDAFDAKFQSLFAVQTDLQNRMTSQEQATCALEERIDALETKYEALSKHNGQLQNKVLELEGRSRRQNIKIVGIKEDSEEGRPTDFVSRLIPDLLGKQHFPHPVKVDRAHRTLLPKPSADSRPRTIIACIHHFQVKEMILRLSRSQPMEYKGNKVLIFPDYTNDVMIQRRAFRDVMQSLREKGIKHYLRYPARLCVHWRNENASVTYGDPAAAKAALRQKTRGDSTDE